MEWMRPEFMLTEVLRRRAEQDPDRVYMRHVDGHTLTYRQSFDASLLWAGALRRLGVEAEDNVLSMLSNTFDNYHAWTGMAYLGAVEVSLNTAYVGEMLRYTVNTSDAKVMVVLERFLPRLADIADQLTTLETIVVPDAVGALPKLPQRVIGGREFFAGIEPEPLQEYTPRPWDTSCIIWTSGTTGPSKGVLVPWTEMYHFNHVITGVTSERDEIYHFLPPFHVGGKIIFYAALVQGSGIILRETFSTRNFWKDVRAFGATHTSLQGAMARMLLSNPPAPDDADHTLRTMGCAPLPADLGEFVERFGLEGVNTYYGMTEIGLPFMSEGFDLANNASCGKLREGYEVRIVDAHDYPVPPGSSGELIVRTDEPWAMNAGYYGMPENTAKAWRNGWFHTGDAFRVDADGNYYFIDRLKDALRRRGENISSFEVEAGVNEHPDVQETVAVAVASDLGEDDVKVVVVTRPDSELTPAALLGWLGPRMPRYMLPRYVEFVQDLPRTTSHKVKKGVLREHGVTENTWDREAEKEVTTE